MIVPEIKALHCTRLAPGVAPPDPGDCELHIAVEIGVRGVEGGERFSFTAITTAALARRHGAVRPGGVWGHGYLILESFSWEQVGAALEALLRGCERNSWYKVARALGRELRWERDR